MQARRKGNQERQHTCILMLRGTGQPGGVAWGVARGRDLGEWPGVWPGPLALGWARGNDLGCGLGMSDQGIHVGR